MDRTCRKAAYASAREAWAQVESFSRLRSAYVCKSCGKYHVTSMSRSEYEARQKRAGASQRPTQPRETRDVRSIFRSMAADVVLGSTQRAHNPAGRAEIRAAILRIVEAADRIDEIVRGHDDGEAQEAEA